MVEVDEGVGRPDLRAQLLAGHQVAGADEQDLQHLQRPALQAEPYAFLAEFAEKPPTPVETAKFSAA